MCVCYYYYYYYYYFIPGEFFTSALADGLFWSLSDNKSPQVSRTFLGILAVPNNDVVWMVSTCPPTSKSSSPFNNHLVTVPEAPITIGIIIIFTFLSFFNSLAKSRYLSFFSHSFSFIQWSVGTAKSTILQILPFCCCCCCWLLLGLVFWPRFGDLSVCQSPKGVYVRHFLGQLLGCAYTICFVWSNLNFLPTQSCLVLYSLCANLLHSLVMWFMVSSFSPHSQLFCCVLSIFAYQYYYYKIFSLLLTLS